MANQDVQTLARNLVGKSYSERNQPNANQIRRNARANFGKGKISSGFARNTGTGSARGGDILATCITAERLAGVGQDSQTDTTGFKEENREQRERAAYRRRQERARVEAAMERSGQAHDDFEDEVQQGISELLPTSKLDKPNRALNLQETNNLYAKRRRNG